jgi:hypothetical protein
MTRILALGVFVLATAGVTHAQTVTLAPQVVIVNHSEVSSDFEFRGVGFGGALGVQRGRFQLDVQAFSAKANPRNPEVASQGFTVKEFDLRATYTVVPAIGVQLGASGRRATPDFAAQDVGFFRIGLISDNRLARLARVWVRGAYLLAPRFSGGGSAGFAFEIGVGTWIGTPDGRWGLRAEYDLQRIDRTVAGAGVPIQMLVGKVGAQVGF